jgi:hypothetical protein
MIFVYLLLCCASTSVMRGIGAREVRAIRHDAEEPKSLDKIS